MGTIRDLQHYIKDYEICILMCRLFNPEMVTPLEQLNNKLKSFRRLLIAQKTVEHSVIISLLSMLAFNLKYQELYQELIYYVYPIDALLLITHGIMLNRSAKQSNQIIDMSKKCTKAAQKIALEKSKQKSL